MVLAAGRGTRLRPLTDTVPKPMIPVAGRPLLEYVLRLLRRHGFDEVVVNLHHLPEVITNAFGDGRRLDMSITYSHEPELLGTAGAVRQMGRFFDEPFLVYYADNLCNVDLSALWRVHRRHESLATIGLQWMDDPTQRGILDLHRDGRIHRLIEKPDLDQVFGDYLVNAGVYGLAPDILEHIAPDGTPDFSYHVFPALLSAGADLRGHRLCGQVTSTDTPERYAATCAAVESGEFTLP